MKNIIENTLHFVYMCQRTHTFPRFWHDLHIFRGVTKETRFPVYKIIILLRLFGKASLAKCYGILYGTISKDESIHAY